MSKNLTMVKEIMERIGKPYKEAIQDIISMYPEWAPRGGIYSKVPSEDAERVISKFQTDKAVKVEPSEDRVMTITEKRINEFNNMPGRVIDPVKVKAEMDQFSGNEDIETEKINKLSELEYNVAKTIVDDTLIHNTSYMNTLLMKYKYIVRPSFSPRLRKELDAMFIGVVPTNKFNQRFIAYNDKEVLHVYIINK
jgi:hypothetical protein